MKFKEAAYHVLKKEKKPISVREITKVAFKEGLIISDGKTPEATMGAVIYSDIKQKEKKSLFVKVKRGFFGLREWSGETSEEKDETVKFPLGDNLITMRLKEAQFKSDSPTDFEEAIKDAFNFLGFEGELIGGKGDTDVLLTANIGQESFKINVDGKTSKSGKIIDRQIDWISLRDHKRKNKADFIVVVGPSFSGRNLLEQFKVIIQEMQSLQDRLGYFTFDSLAGREKIEQLEIEPKDIEYIISLLKLPFINGVKQLSENKYILTIKIKDIANIFQQISNFLVRPEEKEELLPTPTIEVEEIPSSERKFGSKYFDWNIKGHSVIAIARKDNPYEHYCPINHFQTILETIIEGFKSQNLINTDLIFSMLLGHVLSPDRPFKGKPEEYKIRMTLGILEIEGLIKWTGSKRPIEYKLDVPVVKMEEWIRKNIK